MRVAVVDLGTNSTRLLIAEVEPTGATPLRELERRSTVTRLGEGVDATGKLGDAPRERALAVLREYAEAIEAAGCERRTAVMTSAVRDASNGDAFAATVEDALGTPGRILAGEDEARLTFAGATAARADDDLPVLVADIGGGSTELVVGIRGKPGFHVSLQVGVVRHSERHLADDPPTAAQLTALEEDVSQTIAAQVPPEVRAQVAEGIAAAGTATSCAAIALALEPFDATRVEGYALSAAALARQAERLAALPLAERRTVPGLHPDRAPTIVAGALVLQAVLAAFALDQVTVSDRDILHGVARELAAADSP